jgi:hypothetical protein
MAEVPAALARAVEGCWELAPTYRIVVKRLEGGLSVEQKTVSRLGKSLRRRGEVSYSAADQTLHFEGIGAIHRVRIALRWSADASLLESLFRSEDAPGQWREGVWMPALRCPAGAGLEPERDSSGG